jgi:hypothetical protein
MKMPTVDVLDSMPGFFLTVDVRLKNTWRVILGLRLLALAARILRAEVDFSFAEETGSSRKDLKADDRCRCPCHTTPGMMDYIPCCYTCPRCRQRISAEHMNDHISVCCPELVR